jgi:hypothetical protein
VQIQQEGLKEGRAVKESNQGCWRRQCSSGEQESCASVSKVDALCAAGHCMFTRPVLDACTQQTVVQTGVWDVTQSAVAKQARAVELSALGPKALSFTSQTSSQQAAEERGDCSSPLFLSVPC